MPTSAWSLVLAGGAGRRLASITGGVPKQFWSPDGGSTLLESTLARAARFAPPRRTVVVVDRTHDEFVRRLPGRNGADHWLYQPCDRGTAAGVLLGLAHIQKRDPGAMVILTPSDHGIAQVAIFNRGIESATRIVADNSAEVVLLGVQPDHFSSDYGWIVPASPVIDRATRVAGFVEKPSLEKASGLLDRGAIWNTMVLVGRVSRLLDLFREHLPDLWCALVDSPYPHDLRSSRRWDADYQSLPIADFSRDLISQAQGLSVYVWPSALGWSDLGTPERLARWYQELPSMRPAAGTPGASDGTTGA